MKTQTQTAVVKFHGHRLPAEKRAKLMAFQFPKHCGCCNVMVSQAEWEALPLLGVREDEFAGFALKNHGCGSTMMVITTIFNLGAE